MKKSRLLGAVCAILFTFVTVSANAALVGRLPITPGGTDYQAAYDTVLDITWVTDAGLSGINSWGGQAAWASGLNYLGFDGWRLASMSVSAPVGSLPDTTVTSSVVDCSSVSQAACKDNELGYMFYYNMGGALLDNKMGNQAVGDVTLTDVSSRYWSGTEIGPSNGWYFLFNDGNQLNNAKGLDFYGWAVRDGDISAVPIPPALWLFGSGLLGLVGVARRKA